MLPLLTTHRIYYTQFNLLHKTHFTTHIQLSIHTAHFTTHTAQFTTHQPNLLSTLILQIRIYEIKIRGLKIKQLSEYTSYALAK